MVAVLGALLFLSAGTLAWPGAWAFLAIMLFASGALGAMLLREDPQLLEERLRPPIQPEQGSADKIVVSAIVALFIAWLPLMALDAERYEWSRMPVGLQLVGGVGVLACFVLVGRVFRANAFLTPVVKPQADRGQRVISTGPYAHVRHPMYGGALLFFFGAPLLLGSWWGLAWACLLTVTVGVRAVLEERFLATTLDGYADYMASVRYRFIPGLW